MRLTLIALAAFLAATLAFTSKANAGHNCQRVVAVQQVQYVPVQQVVVQRQFVQAHPVVVQQAAYPMFVQQRAFGGGFYGGGLGARGIGGGGLIRQLLPIAGAVGGASVGGPVGAGVGAALGGLLAR